MADRSPRDAGTNEKREEREANLARRVLAELVGTFFLTTVAAGAEIVAVTSRGQLSDTSKVVAPGLVVMALIYSLGDVSGAHFNPVVTLAFAVRGVFRWSCVPVYWAAQLAAATVAAVGLRALFGDVAHLGAPRTHVIAGKAFAVEAVLTLLLVLVISNTATRARVIGPNAALAVGGTIALCGLIGEPLSGAAMNPARALGPELVAGFWTHAWVFTAGPIVGALVAVLLTAALHPSETSDEVDAAEGEPDDSSNDSRRTSPAQRSDTLAQR
ncbi:MAG TPA: aquaporin [Acidimicrobiia bacterium]|jgi:aquaporin Z|nr:aquaporin [Acidimicrobiia bacterium]